MNDYTPKQEELSKYLLDPQAGLGVNVRLTFEMTQEALTVKAEKKNSDIREVTEMDALIVGVKGIMALMDSINESKTCATDQECPTHMATRSIATALEASVFMIAGNIINIAENHKKNNK